MLPKFCTKKFPFGNFFSIFHSSETAKSVRIMIISPSVRTLVSAKSVVTVLIISTAMRISNPSKIERAISSRMCVYIDVSDFFRIEFYTERKIHKNTPQKITKTPRNSRISAAASKNPRAQCVIKID